MTRTNLAAAIVALSLFAGSATAQFQPLSCTMTNNPVATGTAVNFTLESSISVSLLTGCGLTSVHQGSPAGPAVFSPFICPLIFITVGPGAPWSGGWSGTDNGGNPVPAGTYYIKFNSFDAVTGNPFPDAFFPVRIDDPSAPFTDPTMSLSGPANMGSPLGIIVDAPFAPLDAYIVAASLTTNTGLPLGPTQHLALDQDILWNLSFPVAFPGLFSNLVGSLDINGHTTQPSMALPLVPSLTGGPIAFQGVVLSSGSVFLTNAVTTTLH